MVGTDSFVDSGHTSATVVVIVDWTRSRSAASNPSALVKLPWRNEWGRGRAVGVRFEFRSLSYTGTRRPSRLAEHPAADLSIQHSVCSPLALGPPAAAAACRPEGRRKVEGGLPPSGQSSAIPLGNSGRLRSPRAVSAVDFQRKIASLSAKTPPHVDLNILHALCQRKAARAAVLLKGISQWHVSDHYCTSVRNVAGTSSSGRWR